jgi:hypothetical protein
MQSDGRDQTRKSCAGNFRVTAGTHMGLLLKSSDLTRFRAVARLQKTHASVRKSTLLAGVASGSISQLRE